MSTYAKEFIDLCRKIISFKVQINEDIAIGRLLWLEDLSDTEREAFEDLAEKAGV